MIEKEKRAQKQNGSRPFHRKARQTLRMRVSAHRRVSEQRRRELIVLERREWAENQAQLEAVQEELEASREMYAHLYDYAPVGYATLNQHGSICRINLKAASLLGRSREELIRRTLFALVSDQDRRKLFNYMVKLRTGPMTQVGEFRFLTPARTNLVLQLVGESSENIRTLGGTIRIALVDITEQTRAREAQLESERRFRVTADSAPVLIWLAGPNKLWTYVNRPWLDFTGRTLEQEAGSGWMDGVHPDDVAKCRQIYARAFETRRHFLLEFRLRRQDGKYRWMLSRGLPRFAGVDFEGFAGSCMDITERLEAEAVMREARDDLESRVQERTSELAEANTALKAEVVERRRGELARAQLAAIVESSLDAILREDLQGRITTCNTATKRIFGYDAAELVGRSFASLIHEERRASYHKMRGRLMLGELAEPFETTGLRKGGGRMVLSITVSPVLDGKGEVVGTSTSARDISRRRQLEDQIVKISEWEQQRLAQDLHEGLGQQLAGISCLSNTLMGMLADKGTAEADLAAKISKLLDTAVAQSRDLAHSLQPVAAEPNGLITVLDELADRVSSVFGINCRFDCPEPVLLHDNTTATHLYRIAQEAVTNAMRHGAARSIEVSLRATPQEIILTVRNDGKRFKRKTHGRTGMGLGIMSYRASKVGGNLVVQPGSRGGAEVICTVPAASGRSLGNSGGVRKFPMNPKPRTRTHRMDIPIVIAGAVL